jgi:hypothetical protein
MALRIPLVIVNGQIEQLQAGDTLSAPQSGGQQIVLTNDEATAVVIGAPVYSDANDGFKKAQANAASTKEVIGLVSQSPSIASAATGTVIVSGVMTATTAQWDAVTGGTGGLLFGQKYYLDPATAGMMTTTAPTTIGQYVSSIGVALSTTELEVNFTSGDDVLL